MTLGFVLTALIVAGVGFALASVLVMRSAGARPGVARRLAGPAEWKVGRLLGADRAPGRPVRLVGRIRCRDPLEMGGGERLVAFHRDVELRIGGTWRSIERLRETRSFELWDHDGSLTIDPAQAAEPLIVIPKVWRGDPAELTEPHASTFARMSERHGPATEARSITRGINVTDRLFLVAQPRRDASGRMILEPPAGGYLVTNLELNDAMRLLGGRKRRLVASAIVGLGISVVLLAVGVIGLLLRAALAG
ncbi:MAG: hypothetical protein ACR2GO_08465 [Candidatus Limnocylindria bacterium]